MSGTYAFIMIDGETEGIIINESGDVPANLTKSIWQIASELYAVRELLIRTLEKNLMDIYKKITIHVDYEGIKQWYERKWKIKNLQVGSLIHDIRELASMLKAYGTSIEFIKVSAHSGDKYNDIVDKMCNEQYYAEDNKNDKI